jgi:hypothetical protein
MIDEEFIALERAGWDALSGPQGAKYYRKHLSVDALMAFPFGVIDRSQAIDAIEAAAPWSHYNLTHPSVVRLGEDAAVVAEPVTAERAGEPEFSAIVASTFVRREDRWQLAFHQQSPAG